MASRYSFIYFLPLSIAFFVLACDQKPVDLAPETPIGQWQSMISIDPAPTISSVWSSGPTDVWVATSNGVEHFNGSSWSRPTDQITHAQSVWGASASDVYFAANDRVWHHDGVGWTQTPIGGYVVTGTGPSDVYAVDINRVVRFNGAEWDTILTSTREVNFISVLPGSDCIVSYADSLLRWDGASWTTLSAPGNLNGLWRENANSWFAIGYQFPDHTVWHWDGVAWNTPITIDGYPHAIWGSGQDVFVSGYNGFLLHYDGAVWTPRPSNTRSILIGIGGSSSSDVYAVGSDGHVLRRDGESWASIHPIGPRLAGLTTLWAATPTHAFLGSGDGTVFEYTSGAWSENVLTDCDVFSCGYIYDIAGTSVDNVFASLGNAIARYDGDNWSVSADSLVGTVLDMCALPSGHVFTAGRGGFVFDGAVWTRTYDVEREMRAVWATGPNCAYMVGQGVLRYDGNTWTLINSTINAYDVWGAGCNDIYVAHHEGIAYFDGVRWTNIEPYPATMAFVIGNDRDGVIAISGQATFQLDDAFWRIETMERQFSDVELMLDGTIAGFARTPDGFIAVSWVGTR